MSMRKAINAFCKWCIHDPESGGGSWREQVGNCTMIECPLHPYRPLSANQKAPTNRAQPEHLRMAMEKRKGLQ